MKLIVFGATGGTGRELVTQGLAAGHEVTAFVRDAAALTGTQARVVTGDALDATAVASAIAGHDAVLSALGTRPWRHVDISSGGIAAILPAMQANGVRRVIAMSSQGVGDSKLGALGKVAGLALRRAFRDKLEMERLLEASDREWIVVRPGLLTSGQPRGQWRTGEGDALRGGRISRADVAAFMLAQLASDDWLRKRPVLVW